MSKPTYSLVIAINQPLAEAGLIAFLSDIKEFKIAAHIHSPVNIVESIQQANPDLLITDYNLQGFISLDDLQEVVNNIANLNVLIISSDDDKNSILKSIQLGIKGYLTRECSKEELLLAVHATSRGDKFFCSKILNIILEKRVPDEEDNPILTNREKEILKLLAQGYSTQKIADTFHLSPHTVQTHRKSIIRKLKIKSPTQFVIYALDMGLITQG
jgi:DNA-binding NarL/FixJ family response regulator